MFAHDFSREHKGEWQVCACAGQQDIERKSMTGKRAGLFVCDVVAEGERENPPVTHTHPAFVYIPPFVFSVESIKMCVVLRLC